jgi:Haem-binding domain
MKKKVFWSPAVCLLAMPFVHPFGPVRQQHAPTQLPADSVVLPLLERACLNCHSQQTHWPLYSYLPMMSWAIEKDVGEARQHLDFSSWNEYSADDKIDLLTRLGTEVRSRQMPLPRYLLLHPEARLSDAEIQAIYDWTKAQRRALRTERE